MFGVGVLVFVMLSGGIYLGVVMSEHEFNFKKWSKLSKIAYSLVVLMALIFSILISTTETNPNAGKRKERSDLEKENLRWSHEAYDYIHSGQAAKDMGYR